ncbi:MAG: hypothetical protein AAF281_14420 [Pseudomonadota bacterium]
MDTGISADQWLFILSLGALAGGLGQVLRMVIGLKKALDPVKDPKDADISTKRIVISLLVGASAGALAAILTIQEPTVISYQTILGLLAAGYAGADFIEGAMKKFVPQTS